MNFHGHLSKVESDHRLLNSNVGEKVGRYLVRKYLEKYILSYVDQKSCVQDISLPASKNHSILKHNNLQNVAEIIKFFETSKLGVNLLYQVHPLSHPNVVGPQALRRNQCHACEVELPDSTSFKCHMRQHTVVFCKTCETLFTYREGFPHCRYIDR